MTAWADLDQDVITARDLRRIELALTERFCPGLPRSTVQRCLHEALARFADAPVRNYLTILVQRAATNRLETLAAARSGAPADVGRARPDDAAATPASRQPKPVLLSRDVITPASSVLDQSGAGPHPREAAS